MSSKNFLLLVVIILLCGLGFWLGGDLFEDPVSSRAKKVNSYQLEIRCDSSGY
ncbi:hypothetical protein [Halanaerobaculum tunisiense]